MADPSELFTFRHTFPPSFVSPSLAVLSSSSSTTENELLAQLNDSAPAFPSPDSDLFTFAPSLPPDADFLVGQFDTVPSPRITQGLFPLSATISALQFPEDAEDEQQQKQNIAQQFPGIRRENLLIWRPEQIEGTEESDGGGKLETYLVDEQGEEEEEGKRPRRTLNEDRRTTEEQLLVRAEMEVDIALEGEEDLRAERLRRELGEGIERMLEENTTDKRVRETEREQRKQQQGMIKEEEEKEEMEREERQQKETTGKRDGREGRGRKTTAEGDNQRGREQDRGRNAREEDDKEDEERKGGRRASQLRVTDLHLEYLGRMDTTKKEVVRMHFILEGDRKELEEGVRRIGQMDKTKEEKALMHEVLSKPRLTNGTYAGIPFSPSPSSSASSTLSAISAHSLPALFLGSLCLSAALLIMLSVLRPSARAFSRIKQWKKRIEWKVKRSEGKMGGGGRKRETNGTGILPM